MEKFFEDPDSITRMKFSCFETSYYFNMDFVPMMCGSAFKNKGVQTMLDYVMELLPSPLDRDNIVGTDPDTEKEV